MQCQICHQGAGDAATHSVSGLTVCDACYTSNYLPQRVLERGFHLGFRYQNPDGALHPGEADPTDKRVHAFSALGEVPGDSGMHTKLEGEGLREKLIKIFKHEIQIGEKTFDDAVYIHTNTPDETRAFLSLSGVQNAVMELVGMKGEVDIDGAKLYVKIERKGPVDTRQALLQGAALLHYLSQFS